ncbi:MAG: DUF1569 domain-containing protein [Longimicrobiales bacterium]
MPVLHEASGRANLVDRAARLTAESPRLWGRMTPDQMLWHVNAQMECALGRRECVPIDNLFKRTVIKAVALYGPWPKGKAPTAREMRADGTYDLDKELARFRELVDAFGARPLDSAWSRHPAFGPLTGPQWSLLSWRHANHHLTQFSL